MGGHAYWYYVPYQPNIQTALDALREREFRAGRYNPVMPFIDFPLEPDAPAPGNQHRTIADALEDSAEDGTRSILDLERVGMKPDFCTVVAVPASELEGLYGTANPTREMVEDMEFFEEVDRGHGVYVVLYENDQPSEILFAGVSFD